MLGQLTDAGLDEVEVLVEYQLPRYSGRADVVLLGEHPKGGPSCVVVENKQWSGVGLVDIEHRLVMVPGVPGQERSHPQVQVRGYVEHLQHFNCYLGQHPRSLAGCVYMHNAASASITGLHHPDLADLAVFPVFAADEMAGFRAFLTSRLAPASGAEVADDFLQSKIAPSKQLLQHVREAIAGNPQFTLLDDQQVAFEMVLRAVEHAKRADAKEAVIITGGPGSGKSVIAVALLGKLAGASVVRRGSCHRQQVVHQDAEEGDEPPVPGGRPTCSSSPISSLSPSAIAWTCSSSMRRTGSGK